jgi:ribosomal protein S18 acetylase RimI-like enzyme
MTATPRVRSATLDDVKAILDLHHALCEYEYRNGFDPDINLNGSYSTEFKDYVRSRISESTGIALVATAGAVVVGYLLGSVSDGAKGRRAKLESIFVPEVHRRQGIAQRLVSEFLSWARESGSAVTSAAVAPGNAAAVDLYRKLGFIDQTLVLAIRHPVKAGETRGAPTRPSS